MITNADLISIAFDFLGRRGSSPPAPRFSASFALRPLASASTPSPSLPSEPSRRQRPNGQTVLRSLPPLSQTAPRGSTIKAALRFPHSG